MEHFIEYGKKNIKFKVNRRKRKTLGINVWPSGEVTVDAPEDASIKRVKEIVGGSAHWIIKQKREVLLFPLPLPPKLYLSGEAFWYLGNQYQLSIFKSDNNKVALTKNYLEVYTTSDKEPKKIKKQLNEWFREKAKEVFTERLIFCMARFEKLGITDLPPLKLRKMKKRWGSCTYDGFIILNSELIAAPIDCIEYVIIHELCHLKERHHNQKFYQLMTLALPNWKAYKAKLNQVEIHREEI